MKRVILVSAMVAIGLSRDRLDAQRVVSRSPVAAQAATGRIAVPRDTPAQTDTPRTAAPGTAARVMPQTTQRLAMPRAAALQAQAVGGDALRALNAYVEQQIAGGGLRMGRTSRDPMLPARTVERFQAMHRGVPIWGAGVVRDSDSGVTRAIYGDVLPDLALDTRPLVNDAAATRTMLTLMGAGATVLQQVSLTVLPAGLIDAPRLAYTGVVSTSGQAMRIFVDAVTGAELLRYSEIQTQTAVGTGRGVLGDQKKLSVLRQGSQFLADDQHRPPVLMTFDFKNNLPRIDAVTFSGAPLAFTDIASDSDNTWTDPAVVDAHVHVGWSYDYLFKRFQRRGLDDNNRSISIFTNALSPQAAVTQPYPDAIWSANAFWCGACGPNASGVLFFGSGIPSTFYLVSSGNTYRPLAGALDIAAHELAHGVIDSSSQLIYLFESGALNESFADIIGTSTEFFFHGSRADYTMGEDVSRALLPGARDGDRSMANPALYGQPDHYSNRLVSTTPPLVDNGGVHINSGIPNHAFYLAIEGGVNRTSLLSVQGVGAANREQIERIFYRAFVYKLSPSATFAMARTATIDASRELYGAGSAAERAVTQAWTAVGVL